MARLVSEISSQKYQQNALPAGILNPGQLAKNMLAQGRLTQDGQKQRAEHKVGRPKWPTERSLSDVSQEDSQIGIYGEQNEFNC